MRWHKGLYINPGNDSFTGIRNAEYIDKSGLITYINATINTPQRYTCFSRPRRFGKSFAAKMLCAYYDKSCDSRQLFSDLEVGRNASFGKYLNQFNVLYLDITRFIAFAEDVRGIVTEIQMQVIAELRKTFGISEGGISLGDALFEAAKADGTKFFVIIDEWDALFREEKYDVELQKSYVQLLRGLFKGGVATDQAVAGVYMTGILPIKKYGTESALTDFREYTMVRPLKLAEYIGFTQEEVNALCRKHDMDFEEMARWYDGYSFTRISHVYSPSSVISAVQNEEFGNYWTSSESFESLKNYISINMDGVKDDVIAMLGGQRIQVDPLQFQNDVISFSGKSDIFTLLIHLGYLAYDAQNRQAYIPNLEVADSFRLAVQNMGWPLSRRGTLISWQ